jgi:hypothetical protein
MTTQGKADVCHVTACFQIKGHKINCSRTDQIQGRESRLWMSMSCWTAVMRVVPTVLKGATSTVPIRGMSWVEDKRTIGSCSAISNVYVWTLGVTSCNSACACARSSSVLVGMT